MNTVDTSLEDIIVKSNNESSQAVRRTSRQLNEPLAIGTVSSYYKVSETQGAFPDGQDTGGNFGKSLAYLGDLDGDGTADIAVGADGSGSPGCVWILFFDANAKVESYQEISGTQGGFTGTLDAGDQFGKSLAAIGDLSGDGTPDLAVGATGDDDGNGGNLGAVWILFLASNGTVKSHQKISHTQGSFTGPLYNFDLFATAVAALGDIDEDGTIDIAVGAVGDDDGGFNRGSVWILFMDTDGTVASHHKISSRLRGFTGSLGDNDAFGSSLASLGDLNADGTNDLAVGTYRNDDGGSDCGAIWILFLRTDGTDKSSQKISQTSGGFTGTLSSGDEFGFASAAIGDLDRDGGTELVVGARYDDDGGSNRGALWILFLAANGTVKYHQKISDTNGSFSGSLDNNGQFGIAIVPLDDIDGDGNYDMAVGGGAGGAPWIIELVAASPSPTPSASATPTPSPTSSVTSSPSSSPTPSNSPTSSVTPSPSTTSTSSATPTASSTSTSSASATASTTSTSSATPTPSTTSTSSATPTPTASITSTSSATPSPSTTSTSTASATASSTSTSSASASASTTSTSSATPSPSTTSTSSATPTPTASITSTSSATPSPSTTSTSTASATASSTSTSSATPTSSTTSTSSATPTASTTGTVSATPSISPTPTSSISSAPGATGPSCSDGIKNGKESDIDCGDPAADQCLLCQQGRACASSSNCLDGLDGLVCDSATMRCSVQVLQAGRAISVTGTRIYGVSAFMFQDSLQETLIEGLIDVGGADQVLVSRVEQLQIAGIGRRLQAASPTATTATGVEVDMSITIAIDRQDELQTTQGILDFLNGTRTDSSGQTLQSRLRASAPSSGLTISIDNVQVSTEVRQNDVRVQGISPSASGDGDGDGGSARGLGAGALAIIIVGAVALVGSACAYYVFCRRVKDTSEESLVEKSDSKKVASTEVHAASSVKPAAGELV